VEPVDGWVASRGLGTHFALAIVIPIALTLLLPLEETTTTTGALLGMGIGFALNARAGHFAPRGGLTKAIGRIALGLGLVGVAYLVPKLLLGEPSQPWAALLLHLARYALVSLTGTLVAGWCFVRTGLAAPIHEHVAA
ncbi:MAG: hypothetical protein ACP5G7_10525, partial [Anaerolineae bacterium]